MVNRDLKSRTRQFALRIIRLCEALPKGRSSEAIARQLARCGTSVGANYRAACLGRSKSDFIAKMKIVEEECDESIYWMELLIDSGIVQHKLLDNLLAEAKEILAMVIASVKTARRRTQ